VSRAEHVKGLREALRFEVEQLERLRANIGATRLDEVQTLNWPALIASHERSIELYKARLKDMEAE
jgi:hypothetical protein